jgi:hypothetical protein
MATDIDLYNGGEIAPYDPGPPLQELQPLAPSADNWARTELEEYWPAPPSGPFLFGEQTNLTPQQIQAGLEQMAGAFKMDMSALNYPPHLIDTAIKFMKNYATKAPIRVTKRHNFELFGNDDWMGQAFANHLAMRSVPGTPRQKQHFLIACLQWLSRLSKPGQQQVAVSQAPRMAPNSTESLLSQLSEAELEQVTKINEAAKAQTYHYLEKLWGDSFTINLKMVDDYIKSLPLHEHVALDVITTGWVFALNTKEVILGLYQQAIGVHSLPSGGAVQSEIEECQHIMKVDRKRWNSDERLQARYRTLLELQSRR